MRLAFYQIKSPAGDVPAGLSLLKTALAEAAIKRVDMLVLPELFLLGYNAVLGTPDQVASDLQTSVAWLCAQHGVALTLGLPERANGKLFNSAFSFGPDVETLASSAKSSCLALLKRLCLFPTTDMSPLILRVRPSVC
ncbi:MAG: nitrilase-related carbon-nitrogen hydrolase [Aliishimia sp.]